MHTQYDLIIVGTGLVGASLATALQQSHLKILCLDKKSLNLDANPNPYSRPISLSYASVCLLKNLKVWENLAAVSTPIQKVHVSTQGNFGRLQFSAAEYGLEALGYVVPFAHLEKVLLQKAFHNEHAGFLEITEIIDLKCTQEKAELSVLTKTGPHKLEAELVVAADGTYSELRQLLNIKTTGKDDHEVGFTARIQLKNPHQDTAYERFTNDGTFALLPLPEAYEMALVWSMPSSLWQEWQTKTEPEILTKVQAVFGYRLGKMLNLKAMSHYPLVSLIAETQIHPSAVLIGNAAHSVYPLTAQGFNLGLRDATVLATLLSDAKIKNENLGSLKLLENYQQQRQQDQKTIQDLTENLHTSFSLKLPGFNALRAAILLGIDLLSPVKRKFARHCLGFSAMRPPK